MILDDGGDATLLLHLGTRAEKMRLYWPIQVQKKKSVCLTPSKKSSKLIQRGIQDD